MSKLRAAILIDGEVTTTNRGNNRDAMAARNILIAAGFEVTNITFGTSSPLYTSLPDYGYDIYVIPYAYTGNTLSPNYFGRFLRGDIDAVVFCLGVTTSSANIRGTTAYSDGSAGFQEGKIVRTGGTVHTNSRRHALDTTLVAPAAATALASDSSDETIVSAWKHTADGTNYVYYTTQQERYSFLPLLLQEAVNDGKIDANKLNRIPVILSIDHLNGGGDFGAHAPTEVGGFQNQPDKIAEAGNILRSMNGICYADMEQKWILDNGTSPNSGTTTGTLLTNLLEYRDVFKLMATHDHLNEYADGLTPWDGGTAKTTIDTSYTDTRAAIEGLGLSVQTDFATFATNFVGDNWFQLAQDKTHLRCDPDDTTPQAGLAFKMARVSDQQASSYPRVLLPLTNGTLPHHWMSRPSKHRGIVCVPGRDIGFYNNGSDADAKVAFNSYSVGLEAMSCGTIPYFHHTDFEDATVQASGVSTDNRVKTYAIQTWQAWADLQSACPDIVDMGADITNYV